MPMYEYRLGDETSEFEGTNCVQWALDAAVEAYGRGGVLYLGGKVVATSERRRNGDRIHHGPVAESWNPQRDYHAGK
jgi:hypothetical protein